MTYIWTDRTLTKENKNLLYFLQECARILFSSIFDKFHAEIYSLLRLLPLLLNGHIDWKRLLELWCTIQGIILTYLFIHRAWCNTKLIVQTFDIFYRKCLVPTYWKGKNLSYMFHIYHVELTISSDILYLCA